MAVKITAPIASVAALVAVAVVAAAVVVVAAPALAAVAAGVKTLVELDCSPAVRNISRGET